MEKLKTMAVVPSGVPEDLLSSYDLLRDVQTALRIQDERARNQLPTEAVEWAVLAQLLGFETTHSAQTAIEEKMDQMRAAYDEAMDALADGLTR
jgi:glutamine synthetase adenylyltransferase